MLPSIVERFENAPKSSGEKRKFFALTALNVVRDHPVAGVGINNWAVFLNGHEGYQDTSPAGLDEKGNIGIVETIYLLTAAECGWVGLVLLLAWFLYYWGVALRLAFRLARTEWAYVPAGILGGLIAYPVAAFVLDSKVVALWFFVVAFLPNTCIGAACGAVLYKILPIRKFAEELKK